MKARAPVYRAFVLFAFALAACGGSAPAPEPDAGGDTFEAFEAYEALETLDARDVMEVPDGGGDLGKETGGDPGDEGDEGDDSGQPEAQGEVRVEEIPEGIDGSDVSADVVEAVDDAPDVADTEAADQPDEIIDPCANLSCDDDNPCTTDGCDPATGCVHEDNALPCDDLNECTTDDVCAGGACAGVYPPGDECDDGNPCTTETCDLATGCHYEDNELPCDDASACTDDDTCQAGACLGVQDPSCSVSTIGVDGGVVEAGVGSLTIPAGALDAEVEVSVREAEVSPDLPIDGVPGGDATLDANGAVTLAPSDLELQVPGIVTLPLAIAARPNLLVPVFTLAAGGASWSRAALADGSPIVGLVSPQGDAATFVTDRPGTFAVSSLPRVFVRDDVADTPLVQPGSLFSVSAPGGLPALFRLHDATARQAAYEEVLHELVLRTGKERSAPEQDLGARLADAIAAYDLWKGSPDYAVGELWYWLSDLLATVPDLGGKATSPALFEALAELTAALDDLVDQVGPLAGFGACVAEGFLTGGVHATLDYAGARNRLQALQGGLKASALFAQDPAYQAAITAVEARLAGIVPELWTPFAAFVDDGLAPCGAELVTNVGSRLLPWITTGVLGLTGAPAAAITLSYQYLLQHALFQDLGVATNQGVSLAVLGTLQAYGGLLDATGAAEVPLLIDVSDEGQRGDWLAAQTASHLDESTHRVTAAVLAAGDAGLWNRALTAIPGFLDRVAAVVQAFDDEADTHAARDREIADALWGYCEGLADGSASPLCATGYEFPGPDQAPTGAILSPGEGAVQDADFDVTIEATDDHRVRTATLQVTTGADLEVFTVTTRLHAAAVTHTWQVTGTSDWGVGEFTLALWLGDGVNPSVLAATTTITFGSPCTPQCAGRECGADGCDGTCGSCNGDETCTADGQCVVDSSGLTWVQVPGGTFQMGSTTGGADEQPVHAVTLSTFAMAQSETTAAQYQACVAGGSCTASWSSLSSYCTADVPGKEDHPINCVSWTQAKEFCEWAGARLCTEAEWEYAARSGGLNQKYPWGDAKATCDYAVMFGGGDRGCGLDSTWAVCSKPAGNSAQGVCDLSGSVWEWVADRYGTYPVGAQTDPTGPSNGSDRVRRGGSWGFDVADALRAAFRFYAASYYADDYLGLRCCRTVY